jgi:hypothetical protein
MKFSPGLGVGAMSGSQGGITASHGNAGQYFRTRTIPTNPQTAAQTTVRTNLGATAAAWGTSLSDAQREGWFTFAANYPITDALGQPLQLTGSQAFSRLNARLLAAGLSMILTAPTDQNVTDLLSITASVVVTGSVMTVAFDPSPIGADDVIIVRATPAFSPGKSYFTKMLRQILVSSLEDTTPLDVSAAWIAKFGSFPAAGTKVGFEVNCLRSVNGAYDAVLRATATVTAS